MTANDAGDADTGANNLQNFPVLTAAGGVQSTLNSTANATFTIQHFRNAACDSSGNGEGATFLGQVSVTTDANGSVTLPLFNVASGAIVTATATSAANDTSEFLGLRHRDRTVDVHGHQYQRRGGRLAAAGDSELQHERRAPRHDRVQHPGAGPHTIVLAQSLPIISDPVIIDGSTEPDYVAGAPAVMIDGSALPDAYGLLITGGNTVVRGLVISGFGAPAGSTNGIGIVLENAGSNVIEGNFIGTDVAGTAARPIAFTASRRWAARTTRSAARRWPRGT